MDKPKVEIQNWRLLKAKGPNFILSGHAVGHPHLGNQFVYTSKLKNIDFDIMEAETLNTIYVLGKPADAHMGSY